MKIRRQIVLAALLLLGICPIGAQQSRSAAEVEQEQRFAYYFYAAEESLRQQKYPEAFLQLQMCLTFCPEDGKTNELLGRLYEALGETEKAFSHYEAAYRAEPLDLWQLYVGKLLKRTDKASRKQAVKIVEKVVKERPKETETWEQLMQIYQLTGKYRRAIRAQDKIDHLRGYDAYSALNRYRTYVMWDKPKQALRAIERYLEEDPSNLQFLLFRIQLYEHMGVRWSTLEGAYQQILSYNPQNALILNNYAYGLAIHGGDLKRAERMSEMAIRQEPDNATYLDTYAWILHLQGQDTLAAFYIRKAMNLADERDQKEIKKHYEQIIP